MAVEGTAARIVRIDPATGEEVAELDIRDGLNRVWNTKVGYVIAGYNDMTKIPDARGGFDLLIGFEVFLPPDAPTPVDHTRVDGLDSGGWYFVRHADGSYDLHQIETTHLALHTPLVATRTITLSPFADDPGRIYFGGFDAANKHPVHNTAWIISASTEKVLHGANAVRVLP